MTTALLVVTAVLVEGRSRSEVARDYVGIAPVGPEAGQTLRARGRGRAGPTSRRLHRCPHQVDRDTETRIVELRKQLSDLGLDAGAASIAAHLDRNLGSCPSVAPSGAS